MDAERLKRIEDIYHAALEIPAAQRESFLKKNCGEDADLRREVESLLKFETTAFLDRPPESLAAEIISQKDDDSRFAGKKLGRYRIKKLLGRGGMGEVFLAEDTELERLVAVKILPEDFSGDGHRVSRFLREAKAVSALNHPNILTIYETGIFQNSRFIVTEYIEGETLREKMTRGDFDLREILDIGGQIAAALSAAHSAGIVHRDIKPENVILRKDRLVKVLDFGLAKLAGNSSPSNGLNINEEALTRQFDLTNPGMVLGTTNYMSPEQVRGRADIDARSDIWSLGVVIFEMLTGRVPFAGETVGDIIASILKTDAPLLSKCVKDCPAELERIISKTLQKRREERYQDVKDLALDLKSLNKELEFSAERERVSATGERHQTSEIPKQVTTHIETGRRFLGLNALAVLIIAGLMFGGAWWFFSKNEPAENAPNLKQTEVVNWTSAPGETYSVGSFSPDAKMIAFASGQTGQKNIWVKQTTSGDAVQITKDEYGNKNPVWSPDGDELAYHSTRGNEAGIWRIPILGGTPKLVAAIENPGSSILFWSKNNLIYFESKNEIFALDANSGRTKQISDLKAKNIKPVSTNISPDEQLVVYITVAEKIWSVRTSGPAGERGEKIFESPTEIKNVFWHTDSRRVFFSSLVDEIFQVFVTGGDLPQPKQLTFGDRDIFVVDVSADGEKILLGSAKEESDIWGFNIRESKEFTVASDINSELWGNVSPDGKTIAYQSIKNPSQGNKLFYGAIFTKSLESDSQAVQLAPEGFLPVWSPDGQKIAFMRVVGKTYQLETIEATGVGQKTLAADGLRAVSFTVLPYSRLQTNDFSWSPDGGRIAYISDRGGADNIWLVSSDGAANLQLSANNDEKSLLECPIWSADGKYIAYTSKTNNPAGKTTYGVWIIETETKISRMLTRNREFYRLLGWTKEGDLLTVSTGESSIAATPTEVSLKIVETQTGNVREITKHKDTYLFNVQLSPDAGQVAFAARRDGKDNIWITTIAGGDAKQATNNNDPRLYFSNITWSPGNDTIFFGKQTRFSLLSMLTNFK